MLPLHDPAARRRTPAFGRRLDSGRVRASSPTAARVRFGVDRLCERLGVTKGSFYWHFADLRGLPHRHSSRPGAGCRTRTVSASRIMPEVEPRERLRTMMQAVVRPAAVRARAGDAGVGVDRRRPSAANVRKSDGRVLRAVHQAFVDGGFEPRGGAVCGRWRSSPRGWGAARFGPGRCACRGAGTVPGLHAPALAADGFSPVLASRYCEQVVGGQLDVLVPPLRSPIDAGDQARAVNPAEIAVHERVPRLGSSLAPSVRPRCHSAYSSQEWFSKKAFCASARGCTSPSRCPARTAARRSACGLFVTAALFTTYLAIG